MLKKKCFENYLVNFSSNCILFKKYYQYNLWFGSFGEYLNIKYCKKYIQKYIYFWIHFFLLKSFSLNIVRFLYKSPCFLRFVESGVLKYVDYHFLVSFYNNCFTFDLKGKQNIKFFFRLYFQKNLKKRFENDLLFLVIKVLDDILLNDLIMHLTKSLKDIQIYIERIRLNEKVAFKLVTIKNKKEIYFLGLRYFKYLTKKGYYKPCIIKFNNLYSFTFLKTIYRPLLKVKSSSIIKTYKSDLNRCYINKKRIENFFITFSQNTLDFSKKDIQHLIQFVEPLTNNTGIYKNSIVFFEDISAQNSSKKKHA